MVIRLGRNGRFLACSLFPEHKESRPLPGDEAPAAGRRGRGLPDMRRGDARRQARPVRAVRRLLALPGLHLHQEGRSAAAGPAAVRGRVPEEPRRPPRAASRAPDRERLLGLLELPEVRLHDELRAGRRGPRRRRRAGGAGTARPGSACVCGAAIPLTDGVDLVGQRLEGGPPNPEALAKPARGGGARRGRTAGGSSAKSGGRSGGARPAARGGSRRAARPPAPHPTRDRPGRPVPGPPGDRGGDRGVTDPAAASALDRFLGSLAARDTSEHTQRSYAATLHAYLDWLAARGVDWRTPTRADLRTYLAVLGMGRARSSTAQRLAAIRSFHRFAAREELAPGDPWGAIATPRLPRRLPRVLEVDEVERLLAAVDAAVDAALEAGEGSVPSDLTIALAIRDRAIVETAYAAGLRISELASAELGRARPAARRDPGPRQGPQGADRAARAAGPGRARGLPRGRPARRSPRAGRGPPDRTTARPRSS